MKIGEELRGVDEVDESIANTENILLLGIQNNDIVRFLVSLEVESSLSLARCDISKTGLYEINRSCDDSRT